MRPQHARLLSRRRFLGGLTLAGAAGLLGLHPRPVAAEPSPETTTLRLARTTSICQAPQYVAEALFEAEGFTEVQLVGEGCCRTGPWSPATPRWGCSSSGHSSCAWMRVPSW